MLIATNLLLADANIFEYFPSGLVRDGIISAMAIGIGAGAFALGHQLMRNSPMDEATSKLATGLSGGLCGLLCFLLGLTLNNARENYYRAIQSATEEALQCRLLYEDMALMHADNASGSGGNGQALVKDYVRCVVHEEWESLNASPPCLHGKCATLLSQLRPMIDPKSGSFNSRAWTGLGTLEHLRLARLRFAKEQTPDGFWLIIALLLAMTCGLCGVNPPTTRRLAMTAVFCVGIGIVCLLIDQYERPYGGWIAIDAKDIFQYGNLTTGVALPP